MPCLFLFASVSEAQFCEFIFDLLLPSFLHLFVSYFSGLPNSFLLFGGREINVAGERGRGQVLVLHG